MKKLLKSIYTLFCLVILVKCDAQESGKTMDIDSIVSKINSSDYFLKRDSLSQNILGLNTNMQRILSTYFKGKDLIKHVNYANILNLKANDTLHTVGENIFYYDHNSLIKVEEYFTENGKMKMNVSWYFSKGQLLNYIVLEPKSSETAERTKLASNTGAKQLLITSNELLKDFRKQ
ncbi:hypothetical protein [Rhizosphaericola mali]|uniref:DUF4252 domain-containing protein n=1 Tax=Rhizosphaericola mali TaxID=2545455 RepID=A0A5P2G2Z4_9BACT|nr:hypothetical protein [Rhizosphaericola mali]QES88192.1 hypothetical protein E0W69_005760 [Rhizosphaericola mali]